MTQVKFVKTTSDNLPEIVDGQIIAVNDTGELYIDDAETRVKYGGEEIDTSGFLTDADVTGTGELSVRLGDSTTADGANGIAIGYNAIGSGDASIAIGTGTTGGGYGGTAVGANAKTGYQYATACGSLTEATGAIATALGSNAKATNYCAIQIGPGTNSVESTLNVGLSVVNNYKLLQADGTIPEARIPATIARTSAISSWSKVEDTSTGLTFVPSDMQETLAGELTSLTITGGTFQGDSVLHFTSGATATTLTSSDVKFVGLHVWDGAFTPCVNMRYKLMFSYDGLNLVCSVGGYSYGP